MFEEIKGGIRLTYRRFELVIIFFVFSLAVKYIFSFRSITANLDNPYKYIFSIILYLFLVSATLSSMGRSINNEKVFPFDYLAGGLKHLPKIISIFLVAILSVKLISLVPESRYKLLLGSILFPVSFLFSLATLKWIESTKKSAIYMLKRKTFYLRSMVLALQVLLVFLLSWIVILNYWEKLVGVDNKTTAITIILLVELIRNSAYVAIMATLMFFVHQLSDTET